ncbi:hypothetical protein DFH09DRAFT_1334570 [Mycena vulgaris]|nr:hypothetical protein DFH09DRAFT_1334570 [Mycena vulgaris]
MFALRGRAPFALRALRLPFYLVARTLSTEAPAAAARAGDPTSRSVRTVHRPPAWGAVPFPSPDDASSCLLAHSPSLLSAGRTRRASASRPLAPHALATLSTRAAQIQAQAAIFLCVLPPPLSAQFPMRALLPPARTFSVPVPHTPCPPSLPLRCPLREDTVSRNAPDRAVGGADPPGRAHPPSSPHRVTPELMRESCMRAPESCGFATCLARVCREYPLIFG